MRVDLCAMTIEGQIRNFDPRVLVMLHGFGSASLG